MSASREKQNRRSGTGRTDPKTAREAQQRKEEKRSNLLYGAIAAVFLIVVIVSAVWRSNLIPQMTTAASIDGQNYSAAEVAYYYQTAYRSFVNGDYSYLLNYMGLDPSAPLKSQEIAPSTASILGISLPGTGAGSAEAEGEAPAEGEEDTSTGMTWHDYFLDQAIENMTVIQATLKAADAEGFQTPAGVQAQYDDNMAALKSVAAASGVSFGQYLKGTFGSGVTEKIYGEHLMRALRYGAYVNSYRDSLTYSDSELGDVYNANRNSFDHVSYEISTIAGDAPSSTDADGNTVDPTEEESAAALEAAQEIAQALLDGVNAGGKLETLVDDYEDATYTENSEGSYDGGVVSEWLYDDARKDGDAAVLEDGTLQNVVIFHDRFRDEEPTVDIRHILVPLGTGALAADGDGYEDEQAQLKADAHARAEELLAQWQSGEATEESFAALAMAESTDGSRYDGGLYTEVYQGQMVTEFNDWCFDASRKPGDTGVVDTQYGSHVMYFSGTNMERWKVQAANILRNEALTAWEDSLVENVTVQRNESGLKFVG